jgi:hypothetical protein
LRLKDKKLYLNESYPVIKRIVVAGQATLSIHQSQHEKSVETVTHIPVVVVYLSINRIVVLGIFISLVTPEPPLIYLRGDGRV